MSRRPRRLLLIPVLAALGVGVLSSPAAAADRPAGPVVTPSTTAAIAVGTPMTMQITPGSLSDQVYGYAWTWQVPSAPTYSTLPSCPSSDATGGLHFVCGSSITVRVSPESAGFARFTVWAFDSAGNRSDATTVTVSALHDVTALYPVSHQWTTDQYGTVPQPANCAVGAVTVQCVPDTAGVDDQHPNGTHPLLLPPGVTWDGSGGWVPGVLTFGSGNTLPAGTLGAVIDTRRSFTAGAWLTPTAAPTGTASTGVAQERGLTGFELGLTGDSHWQFRVHTGSGAATAVTGAQSLAGSSVYIAGVWDAVNREVRLYVNGGLAAVSGFDPRGGAAPLGGVTVGGRWSPAGLAEPWTGQVGNPVVAQAALPPSDLGLLSNEMFFPGGDSGLG